MNTNVLLVLGKLKRYSRVRVPLGYVALGAKYSRYDADRGLDLTNTLAGFSFLGIMIAAVTDMIYSP